MPYMPKYLLALYIVLFSVLGMNSNAVKAVYLLITSLNEKIRTIHILIVSDNMVDGVGMQFATKVR